MTWGADPLAALEQLEGQVVRPMGDFPQVTCLCCGTKGTPPLQHERICPVETVRDALTTATQGDQP